MNKRVRRAATLRVLHEVNAGSLQIPGLPLVYVGAVLAVSDRDLPEDCCCRGRWCGYRPSGRVRERESLVAYLLHGGMHGVATCGLRATGMCAPPRMKKLSFGLWIASSSVRLRFFAGEAVAPPPVPRSARFSFGGFPPAAAAFSDFTTCRARFSACRARFVGRAASSAATYCNR